MGMRINTNIDAMDAQRNLQATSMAYSKSVQKLSSGLRINTAADDAAGLSISEKLMAQVSGLQQASRNAQDGISMIQTGEGALNETHSILQRMRELTVQAANDTLQTSDRQAIGAEVNQLTAEINRIAGTTQFNGKNLLDGSLAMNAASTAVGTNLTGATTANTVVNAASNTATGVGTLTVTNLATSASTGNAQQAAIALTAGGTMTINGVQVSLAAADSLATVETKINAMTAQTGVTAATAGGGLSLTSNTVGSASNIQVSASVASLLNDTGLQATGGTGTSLAASGKDATGSFAVTSGFANETAVVTAKGNVFTTASGMTVDLSKTTVQTQGLAANNTVTVAVNLGGAANLMIGANAGQTMQVTVGKMDATSLGVNSLDLSSSTSINANGGALSLIDTAINTVSNQRSLLGAYQNRLEHTISNLGVASENLSASESRIRDVDMASEMVNFTKTGILQQAGQAILAQANQSSSGVLSLLR